MVVQAAEAEAILMFLLNAQLWLAKSIYRSRKSVTTESQSVTSEP